MVKATFVLSALIAITAVVSAAPLLDLDELLEDGLLNIEAEDHIGTGEIVLEDIAENAGQINEPEIYGNCI
jgi:membrane protein implicated in regulation of membrane protease activity